MSIKINNIIISEDDSLLKENGFNIVNNVLKSFYETGLLARMNGNCIGSCEIIGNMLYQKGIKSYMTECQLSVDSELNGTNLIGFDNFLLDGSDYNSQIDTHTILIVLLDDAQIMIDASINYALPPSHPIIVERINGITPDIISEYKFKESSLVYTTKKSSKLPFLKQANLLSSYINEQKNIKKINELKNFIYILILFTLINFIVNLIILIK